VPAAPFHSHVSPKFTNPSVPPKSTVRARDASYAIAIDERADGTPGPQTLRKVQVVPFHSHVSHILVASAPPNKTVTDRAESKAIPCANRTVGLGVQGEHRFAQFVPSHSHRSLWLPPPLPPKKTVTFRVES